MRLQPTTAKNVAARLFFRYFLCYFAAITVAFFFRVRGMLPQPPAHAGLGECVFVFLCLQAALSTVAKPYLLVLTVIKAFYDLAWFSDLVQKSSFTMQNILAFNACFFYLVFSLLLFSVAAARSCIFTAESTERDIRLLLSRRFFSFLIEALIISALALVLYFIWPPLAALFA